MATFSVLLLTASHAGQAAEAGGPFVKIDGRESLLKTVELFLNRDNIKQLQICFLPENLEEAKRKYAPHLSFSGVKVLSGGPRWIDQIAAASGKISADATHVIIHDAARPAVAYADIDALMEMAEKANAITLAVALATHVGKMFCLARIDRQIFRARVFTDDHSGVNGFLRADE